MFRPTRFDDEQVRKNLYVAGKLVIGGIERNVYEVTLNNASPAEGTAPTKAEYDELCSLVNQIKTKYNALLTLLSTGEEQ